MTNDSSAKMNPFASPIEVAPLPGHSARGRWFDYAVFFTSWAIAIFFAVCNLVADSAGIERTMFYRNTIRPYADLISREFSGLVFTYDVSEAVFFLFLPLLVAVLLFRKRWILAQCSGFTGALVLQLLSALWH